MMTMMIDVCVTLFHSHSLWLSLNVVKMVTNDNGLVILTLYIILFTTSSESWSELVIMVIRIKNHLYGDVHALPDAGVGVHHLVLGQEQTLLVTPRQVPWSDAHPDNHDHYFDHIDDHNSNDVCNGGNIDVKLSDLSFSPLLRWPFAPWALNNQPF